MYRILKDRRFILILILLAGMAARVYQFGIVSGDINQDEAYAAYEALSILNYGMDSWGYRFPVYLVAWGSGMNALNTYLMIPWIALFGLHTWVIRLPQLIVACLTVWVVYLLVKEVFHHTIACICMGLTAAAPWHIFLSRWGLESNLAPGFLVFGLYFFVKGIENQRYFILSAVMYGLSLYCYAAIWPIVPVIILLQAAYCIRYKKIKFQKEIAIAVFVLAALAMPLLLFMAVNMGYMNEIKTPFLSIPKLVVMRSGEVGLRNTVENLRNLWHIIVTQTDGLITNATDRYGIFYYCTLPFFFFGLYYILKKGALGIKNKTYEPAAFIIVQFIAAVLLGSLIHVNINRINILFIPMIIISGVGIYWVCESLDKKLFIIIFGIYLFSFIRFEKYYFNEYAQASSEKFCKGLSSAMEAALPHEGTIYVTPNVLFPRVLYYSQLDTKEYIDTVEWENYPSAFLHPKTFGRFVMDINLDELDADGIYVMDSSYDEHVFLEAGYQIEKFDYYAAAYME